MSRWRARALPLLVLTLIGVGSTGCAAILLPREDQLLPAARYSELETHMEARVPSLTAASARDLFYLCIAYSRVKRYDKLFPCLDRFEAAVHKGDRVVNMFDMSATPHLLRAEAHLDFGEYARAVEQARRGHQIVVERDLARVMRVHSLSALALSHALAGEHEQARQHADALEQIGTHYPFTFLKTDKLNGLARAAMALGDFERSLALIREDESIAWARGLTQVAVVATGLMVPTDSVFAYQQLPKAFILNKSLFETGRLAEARAGYDRLLANPRTPDNGDIHWLILFDRGRIAEREGRPAEAGDFYRRAIEVIERQRSSINTETSKIGYVGNKQDVYHRLVAVLAAAGRDAEALEFVERAKARALVDLLASRQDFGGRAGTAAASALVRELDAAERQGLVQSTHAAEPSARRTAPEAAVRERLRQVAPETASLVTVSWLPAARLQALLGPAETLVEFYYHDADAYAFVVTRTQVRAVRLDGAGLVAEVGEFRAGVEEPASRRFAEAAARLHQRLFGPLAPLLTTPDLLVVPHGALHYLPFAALRSGEQYLIDRYSLRQLPSASVLPYLAARTANGPSALLALGNPDLGDPRYDLRFAQDEAVTVARAFAHSRVLLRGEATATAVKTLGGQFSHLHFATHGRFEPDQPLRSGLLLAPDGPGDGLLGLADLYALRLNADLVILSACETGLGRLHQGDDVVGLVRGFLYAGSSAVVASLWQVDDRATAVLMQAFYANLGRMTTREALRQAQLATRAQYDHPFFWAAFHLTGRGE